MAGFNDFVISGFFVIFGEIIESLKEIKLDNRLYGDINAYCTENNLDTEAFITKLLRRAFTVEKFGEEPQLTTPQKQKQKQMDGGNVGDTFSGMKLVTPNVTNAISESNCVAEEIGASLVNVSNGAQKVDDGKKETSVKPKTKKTRLNG